MHQQLCRARFHHVVHYVRHRHRRHQDDRQIRRRPEHQLHRQRPVRRDQPELRPDPPQVRTGWGRERSDTPDSSVLGLRQCQRAPNSAGQSPIYCRASGIARLLQGVRDCAGANGLIGRHVRADVNAPAGQTGSQARVLSLFANGKRELVVRHDHASGSG